MSARLADLGWDGAWERELAALGGGLIPARVTCRHHGPCELLAERGPLGGLPARRLEGAGLPVVGDWVAVRPIGDERKAIIEHVLTRRGTLSRKEAWRRTREQVIAANVDTVLVVTDAVQDLNLRRLERYLVAIAASGAAAAVVVNKADAAEPPALEAALRAAGDVPAYAVSAATGVGLPALRAHLRPGRTAALVGSSGVGKSTLVNRLAGRSLAATRAVSAGGRGRHTTSRRDLYPLRGHGVVIDTPGMRELALWADETAVEQAFADVLALAAGCRFGDCAHRREPGCAVRAAIARGELAPDRLAGYRKLAREVATLERRRG